MSILPKIDYPIYTIEVPSTRQKVKFRPFLVKEEKILIIAMESEDPKQIAEAVKTVISNCIMTKGIKVDQLSTFDIEYLFLNIRGKSVGEDVEASSRSRSHGMSPEVGGQGRPWSGSIYPGPLRMGSIRRCRGCLRTCERS